MRIRRNFSSRAEAEAQRQLYDIGELQGSGNAGPEITRLTKPQLNEAESVFQCLSDKPNPLTFYVDFALQNYRGPEKQKPWSAAIAE